jgi:hypothetical protein
MDPGETIIPDAFNDVLFRETRRALRLNDHSRFPLHSFSKLHSSYQSRYSADSAQELKGDRRFIFFRALLQRGAKKVASRFAQLILLPIVT